MILVVIDAHLALLTFLVLPLLIAGGVAFRIASAGAYRLTRERIATITGYLQETLSGIRVIRSFAQERQHLKHFGYLNDRNRAANMTTVNLNAAYFPAVELLSALVTVEILAVGGAAVIDGHATTGAVFAFVAALNNFFDPIQQLSQLYTTYQSGMAALDKIFELLDEQPDLVDAPGARELPWIRGELRLEGVGFQYRAGSESAWALRDVDLVVPAGQTLALVGATGAGKSTLAKLVARFYDPTEGTVLVDGHDLRSVTAHSLRSQMGIVPQEGFLFSGSVRDNILFGQPGAGDAAVRAAARAVGADDFITALPDGYDTEVGERGVQLSAGQRQLIAFARALVANPRILVLDEATSNVDVHTEKVIEAGLRRLVAGRTAIVIAHRLSTIRQAGRIVVLEHGRRRRSRNASGAARSPRPVLGALSCLGGGERPDSGERMSIEDLHGTVTALAVTPVKGTRLLAVEEIELEPSGARGDRCFFVIDEHGRMVNGKAFGSLQSVVASFDEDAGELTLSFPDGHAAAGRVAAGEPVRSLFYSRPREVEVVEGPWSEALSDHLGAPVRLVRAKTAVDRGRDGAASLISRGSLARLAEEGAVESIDARRFRMLIEIDGVPAHAEDAFVGQVVRVGEAQVRFNGYVGRCMITTRHPETGEVDLPTLHLLQSYRGHLETDEALPFGVYGAVRRAGRIRLGDSVALAAG